MTAEVFHGDCLKVIPDLMAQGRIVDAVCCDPPYHLAQIQKRFGKNGSAPAHHGRDGAMSRMSSGFMSEKWDSDVAFHPETWVTIGTIMRPGAFLVAFGGTRTVHRLASAIEDAGFVIQDSILDIIASDARVKRLVATLSPAQADALSQILDDLQQTGALAWAFGQGFPKRRDMLKPAFEPIVLAYKPGGKRTLQVDECRIVCTDKAWGSGNRDSWREAEGREDRQRHRYGEPDQSPNGRWPANLAHDGSEEVIGAFPEGAGQQGISTDAQRSKFNVYGDPGGKSKVYVPRGDSGYAARFFYSSKAGPQDRWGSRHPTVKPVELMKWLVSLVTPIGGRCLDPFAGSGTTGVAALATGRNCILIEKEDQYHADIIERMAFYEGGGAHSVQAKNRNRRPYVREDDLFAPPSTPRRHRGDLGSSFDACFGDWQERDALGSYNEAIRVIGERVKAGEPVPECMRSAPEKKEIS